MSFEKYGHVKKARRLFEAVDIANLEKQVLSRYGWKYEAKDMETLASNWGKAKREYLKQASNA